MAEKPSDMVRAWKDLTDAYRMRVFDALQEGNPAAARTLTRSMSGTDVASVLKTTTIMRSVTELPDHL